MLLAAFCEIAWTHSKVEYVSMYCGVSVLTHHKYADDAINSVEQKKSGKRVHRPYGQFVPWCFTHTMLYLYLYDAEQKKWDCIGAYRR